MPPASGCQWLPQADLTPVLLQGESTQQLYAQAWRAGVAEQQRAAAPTAPGALPHSASLTRTVRAHREHLHLRLLVCSWQQRGHTLWGAAQGLEKAEGEGLLGCCAAPTWTHGPAHG